MNVIYPLLGPLSSLLGAMLLAKAVKARREANEKLMRAIDQCRQAERRSQSANSALAHAQALYHEHMSEMPDG